MKKRNVFIRGIFLVLFLSFFSCFTFKLIPVYKKYIFLHDLGEIARKEADNLDGDCSFIVKNLGFPELRTAYYENKLFPAASLIKLPLLVVALKAVEEKKITLEQKIIIKRKDITGGSGKLKAIKLPYTLTVKELLEFMITASDNTAANKVIKLLGYDYINDSFKKVGLERTLLVRKMMDFSKREDGVENYTSAFDIAYLLEKIYNKCLIGNELSVIALSFLKKQKVNDRLPRYLPKETVVAHKTGLERGVVHDAGIVFTPMGDYIICVLARNIKSYKKTKKFIAQLSLFAYNLYQ